MVREQVFTKEVNGSLCQKTMKKRRACKLAPGPRWAFARHVDVRMVRGLGEVWQEHWMWSRRVQVGRPDDDCPCG